VRRETRENERSKREKSRGENDRVFCFIKKKEKNETKILSRPIGGVGSIQ